MHAKIIKPDMHGKAVYDNKGSSAFLVSYLHHELKDRTALLSFFNAEKDGIAAAEERDTIDNNVKGLRKNESKFIALVLSPSREELAHIGNDPDHLKAFTRKAMEAYAAQFKLKDGKTINADDLVWFATIHKDRTYKGTDKEVQEGKAKSGERKPGMNSHVHVIVSKRDKAQKVTLSPHTSKARFNMVQWQRESQQQFNQMFAFMPEINKTSNQSKSKDAAISPEAYSRYVKRIEGKLAAINHQLPPKQQLKQEQVLAIGEKKQFNKTFFHNLNRLAYKLNHEQLVRDPLHLLEHNKDRQPAYSNSIAAVQGRALAQEVKSLSNTDHMGFTEAISLSEKLSRAKKKKRNLNM